MAQLSLDTTLINATLSDTTSPDTTLLAIHECVNGSTIRHIIDLPLETLLRYLSTFPFYRGADTLYYLLLQRYGENAHYSEDGRHMVAIQPELLGVYIFSEQNIYAPLLRNESSVKVSPSVKDVSEATVYRRIVEYIPRTLMCKRYQMRNTIIMGEATWLEAVQIPSISLNMPIYQEMFKERAQNIQMICTLIGMDFWEGIDSINSVIFDTILSRIAFSKGSMPNLWNLALREYYKSQLLRLKILNLLPYLTTRQITTLNGIYPELVNLPSGLDTLGIRIWFSMRDWRCYALGIDTRDGLPSDEFVSERLRHLKELGIERYCNEITGIEIGENKRMTGKIGTFNFPELKDKELVNIRDLSEISLNVYYPSDLFPLISGDKVVILTRRDMNMIMPPDRFNFQGVQQLLNRETIPYLIEPPSEEIFLNMITWISSLMLIKHDIPARVKLVETMTWDSLTY